MRGRVAYDGLDAVISCRAPLCVSIPTPLFAPSADALNDFDALEAPSAKAQEPAPTFRKLALTEEEEKEAAKDEARASDAREGATGAEAAAAAATTTPKGAAESTAEAAPSASTSSPAAAVPTSAGSSPAASPSKALAFDPLGRSKAKAKAKTKRSSPDEAAGGAAGGASELDAAEAAEAMAAGVPASFIKQLEAFAAKGPDGLADALASMMEELEGEGPGLGGEGPESLGELTKMLETLGAAGGPPEGAPGAAPRQGEPATGGRKNGSGMAGLSAGFLGKGAGKKATKGSGKASGKGQAASSSSSPARSPVESSSSSPPASMSATLEALAASAPAPPARAPAAGGVPEDLSEDLFAALNAQGGAEGGMAALVEQLMKQILAKDVLYAPMKEIAEKYPAWLESHRDSLSTEELEKYQLQQRYIHDILRQYDSNPDDITTLMQLLQQMQSCGQPPQDIIDELAPGLSFGPDGLPSFAGEDQEAAVPNCPMQ